MQKPNLRKLLQPDKDFVLFEADMSKADLMVVIWDSDDQVYKSILQTGENLHNQNATAIFGEVTSRTYKLAKVFAHGSNYGSSPKTLATMLGLTINEAQRAQDRYFLAHPAIKHWQERIKRELVTRGEVKNIFGQPFISHSRNATKFTEAVAWIPQSTVALNCTNAMLALEAIESKGVQILLQVHDSIVFQVHYDVYPDLLPEIYAALHQVVPYPDPLIIPWELKGSARSWGDAIPISWSEPTDLETLKKPK